MTITPEPLILIIGAADTGRAPMTVALLGRLLSRERYRWRVASAGVVGHDGDPAEPEARYAMAARNLDLSAHRARALDDALVGEAAVLLAVERGIARVLQERYPQASARIAVLGELAGTRRDIPDPFRMQTGAWISYAQEIENLLKAALPALSALLAGESAQAPAKTELPASLPEQAVVSAVAEVLPSVTRDAALARSFRVLTVVVDFPGVLDWPAARRQIAADLGLVAGAPLADGELVQPYVAVLNALLALTIQPPTPAQRAQLMSALQRLHEPIDNRVLAELSQLVSGWASLDVL
jgi:protein-tyrosine-phosphatase